MRPSNLLVLMSDEHNPKFLRSAGHPFIETPNLDALAARGTRFTSAYTTCPICVPARAAFAVGRYVHEIGYRDNGDAYEGAVPSWHHALRDAGHRVVSIGKLHFRGRPGDDHGFSQEIVPMHVVDGIGDVKGLVRDDIPKRKGGDKMAHRAGPGESSYVAYDRDIASRAQIWLHEEAPKWAERPWVLFVSIASAPSVPRAVRVRGRLRHAFHDRRGRQARGRRLQRAGLHDGREHRQRAARVARHRPHAQHTRHLYERSRRQRRRSRTVG